MAGKDLLLCINDSSTCRKHYFQLEKEGLAVVFGVKKFHSYLYGQNFVIYSDQQSLRHLLGETRGVPTMAAARIQQWALTPSASIAYRPGRNLANADALSRLPLDFQVQVPPPGELLLLREHLNTSSPVTAE